MNEHAWDGKKGMPDASSPTVALLPGGDRFEDFFARIGVSLEVFCQQQTGGWLLNYVEALAGAGVRTVLVFASARVSHVVRRRHRPSGATVCVLPSPRLHLRARGARERFAPESTAVRAVESYLATPVRALARELRRQRCDVILCQEYESTRFDLCVLLGRVTNRPVFATFQGADRTASAVERLFRRAAVRGCDGLVVPAARELRRVERRYGVPHIRLAHIPNPLDVQAWRPADRSAARSELGIPLDAAVVVWHGRVQVHRKGLDVLLDAWKRVWSARPGSSALLLLVGSGRDAADLRRRLGALDPRSVLWVDRYLHDHELLSRYLSAGDVAALPSRHEGFPVAALEAMACGLPLVASDVPGVADILEGGERSGGVIVPPGDPEALADALQRVLDGEAWRRQLGSRARSRAEERFSLQAVGEQLRGFLVDGRAPDR